MIHSVLGDNMDDKTMFERLTELHTKNDIGIYYCGKRIDAINHRYGPDIRNHYLFVLVNSGEATLYGEKEIILKEHDMLVMCPGEKIYYKANTPWSIQWIGLYGDTVEEYTKKLGISGKNPVFHVSLYNELEIVMDKLYSLAKSTTAAGSLLQISLVYNFFSLLFECFDYKDNVDCITTAVKIIDYNFNNDITVEKIAKTLHLTPAHLTRKFRAATGLSPKQYILNKRIEYAKELLANTNSSIFEIANSVGFFDQLYFSRIFKIKEGMSPSEYRKQLQ